MSSIHLLCRVSSLNSSEPVAQPPAAVAVETKQPSQINRPSPSNTVITDGSKPSTASTTNSSAPRNSPAAVLVASAQEREAKEPPKSQTGTLQLPIISLLLFCKTLEVLYECLLELST